MAKVTKKEISEALENKADFLVWKGQVESAELHTKRLDVRMKYVVSGLQIGILPATALQLAAVTTDEFKEWIEDEENLALISRASAFAEAQLEHVVHVASTLNPELALKVLEKRNPKRWNVSEVSTFNKGIETGLKMSTMLKKKQDKLLDNTFDVLADED